MLPFDATEEIAARFGRSMDDLFLRGSFGDGVQFLALFLSEGFKADLDLADRQMQLHRGKEEGERRLKQMASSDQLGIARQKKLLKELDKAIKLPADVLLPEHAQAYYMGKLALLAQLVEDLSLLSEMMARPEDFLE